MKAASVNTYISFIIIKLIIDMLWGIDKMKIIVLSDSHGDIDKAEEAVRSNSDADLIIHLGDYYRDAQKLANMFPDIPVVYIYGNSDFMVEDVQAERLIECCGKKIFLTHGHRYSVKMGYEKLYKKAEELGVDMLLFGHTHVTDIVKRGNYYILNPGSISEPRDDSYESYAIIRIEGDVLQPEIYYIKD